MTIEQERLEAVIRPGAVRLLPDCVFRQSHPAIVGVQIIGGVVQRVEVVDRESVPTTAVLVLDVSTRVAGERLALFRAAAMAFVRDAAGRDEMALVTFNEKLALLQAPTTDRTAVAAALERVEARGSTAVIDALYACLKRRWGSGRPLAVLFTDGRDTASWLENDDVLQAARESSALLYVVGTEATGLRFELSATGAGSRPVRSESSYMYLLQRAADTTGGAYWSVTYDRLEEAFLRVLEAANARYVLSYEPRRCCPSGPSPPEGVGQAEGRRSAGPPGVRRSRHAEPLSRRRSDPHPARRVRRTLWVMRVGCSALALALAAHAGSPSWAAPGSGRVLAELAEAYRIADHTGAIARRISTREWGEARDYALSKGLTRLDGEA